MPDNEYGPFSSEREALATRMAAVIRAAFDAAPGAGAGVPERLEILTRTAAECGVELGDLDRSVLAGIAWQETYDTICVAGMIRRAYEAGQRAA